MNSNGISRYNPMYASTPYDLNAHPVVCGATDVYLFELSPTTPQHPQMVCGRLICLYHNFQLLAGQPMPQYEALSYYGDVRAKVRSITIYDERSGRYTYLPVTEGCYSILSGLRLADRVRLLYIHEICINSGLYDFSTAMMIENLLFVRACRTIVDIGDSPSPVLDYWFAPEEEQTPELTEKALTIDSMNDVLQRPWFHGMWNVRALFSCPRVFVVYRNRSMLWHRFNHFIQRGLYPPPPLRHEFTGVQVPNDLYTVTKTCHSDDIAIVQPRLPSLILFGSTVLCVRFPMTLFLHWLGSIESPEKNFHQAIVEGRTDWSCLIAITKDLISMIGARASCFVKDTEKTNHKGLPSWTIDWTSPVAPEQLIGLCPFYLPYKACGDYKGDNLRLVKLGSFQGIKIRGMQIGTIRRWQDTVSESRTMNDIWQDSKTISDFLEDCLEHKQKVQYKNWNEDRKIFPERRRRISPPAPRQRHLLLPNVDSSSGTNTLDGERVPEEEDRPPKWMRTLGTPLKDPQTIPPKLRTALLRAFCYERTLFSTNTAFIGVGPQSLKPCDIVCCLLGFPAPMVIRRARDHDIKHLNSYYRIVGQAWVYGLMNGEAFAGLDPEQDGKGEAIEPFEDFTFF